MKYRYIQIIISMILVFFVSAPLTAQDQLDVHLQPLKPYMEKPGKAYMEAPKRGNKTLIFPNGRELSMVKRLKLYTPLMTVNMGVRL
jgi:hypothetical protein